MNAKELMIGDWVLHNTPQQVIEYSYPRRSGLPVVMLTLVDKNGFVGRVEPKDIKPIPLTEEILVKNGLQKLNDKKFLLKNQIEIEVGPKFSEVSARYEDYDRDFDSYSNRYIEIAIIHYVHELQHLLRLLGVEKELKL